jgi:hypothetical protein
MPHDPTFNFQGVLEGSLIAKHINIVNVLQHNPEALYFSRCFLPNLSGSNCVDLRRLITPIRKSLQTLVMRWHEIVSRSGVLFLVKIRLCRWTYRHDGLLPHRSHEILSSEWIRLELLL